MKISFIIPAFNAEELIGHVIDSIEDNVSCRFDYDIVVVDNGSIDQTRYIAESKGVRVIIRPHVTISQLRNIGVDETEGDILVFIDSDVCLCKNWGSQFELVLEKLKKYPLIITGSVYGLRDRPSWVEKSWYSPILNKVDVNYINGGHLVTTRDLFDKLTGFDPHYITGEDCNFCLRAQKIGAVIENDPDLKVVHYGYPQTLIWFFRRELWHGEGDFASLAAFFSSCPAIISLGLFWIIVVGIFYSMIFYSHLPVIISIFFIGIVCIIFAIRRSGNFVQFVPQCVLLYFIYFAARFCSGINVLFVQKIRHGSS